MCNTGGRFSDCGGLQLSGVSERLSDTMDNMLQELLSLREELTAVRGALRDQERELVAMRARADQQAQQGARGGEQAEFRRAVRSVPAFTEGKLWRMHLQEFGDWAAVNGVTDQGSLKLALAFSIRGRNRERVRALAIGTAGYANCVSYTEYASALTSYFQPDTERSLARQEFAGLKQGPKEDVGSYLSSKLALWEIAYSPEERAIDTLVNTVIQGLHNPVVKRQVQRRLPRSEEELRTAIMEVVAAERAAYLGGYGESVSLDGLKAVTLTFSGTGTDAAAAMEIDAIQPGPGRSCHRCGRAGHFIAACRAKTNKDGKTLAPAPKMPPGTATKKTSGTDKADRSKAGTGDKKCHRCKAPGHFKRECPQGPGKGVNRISEEPEDDYAEVSFLAPRPHPGVRPL